MYDRISNLELEIQWLLEEMQQDIFSEQTWNTIKGLRKDLWQLLKASKRVWHQKSHIKWYLKGDRNMCFFHNVALARRRANFISKISHQGRDLECPSEIKDRNVNHFEGLYGFKPICQLKELNCGLSKLEGHTVVVLEIPFIESEIWEVINSCDGIKASEPDGFNFCFVKRQWSTIKENVMNFVIEFETIGSMAKGVNASFITLIPKCEIPSSLNDYRSINLVGCLYKIISKALALRLRKEIDEVVGINQFAFI
ncbi:Uncharacterized protein TCM_024321 [Theobroma cacao]|uniref:Reverse transcriptase domain-containing protein n=1 Tax=Theobroma cacao TaxID=3641 RepID=A0A061F383_THECC|nr:Uncharacterized protein TCM_024321 [Theobroma cacao]